MREPGALRAPRRGLHLHTATEHLIEIGLSSCRLLIQLLSQGQHLMAGECTDANM